MSSTIETLEGRIRELVCDRWANLSEGTVANVGLDLDRLAALLREQCNLDEESAAVAARDTFARALLPAHGGDAGWVVLLDDDEEEQLGRGMLMLVDTSPDSSGKHLAGTITNLRATDRGEPLRTGTYRLRFEENGETRAVQAIMDQDAMLPESLAIVFLDEGMPITVSELSAGD